MKVGELKQGMLVKPAGDNEVFIFMKALSVTGIPCITVRSKNPHVLTRALKTSQVMYLGNRKDVKITAGFSNRFVLVGGVVASVDPSSWIHIKKAVISENR